MRRTGIQSWRCDSDPAAVTSYSPGRCRAWISCIAEQMLRGEWNGRRSDLQDRSGGDPCRRAEYSSDAVRPGGSVDFLHPVAGHEVALFHFLKGRHALGAIFGGISLGGAKRSMKTVRSRWDADEYVAPGSLRVVPVRDDFLGTTTTRQYSPREKASSGGSSGGRSGGSSYSRSYSGSSGRSHSGSGRRF